MLHAGSKWGTIKYINHSVIELFIGGLINLILSEGLDTIFDLINGSDYQKVVVFYKMLWMSAKNNENCNSICF